MLGESDMDIEVAHAIAPDATLVYVNLAAFGGKNSSPAVQFQQAFSTVAQEYPGAIWSASLGLCEDIFSRSDAAAVNNAVLAAEQAGTSAFVASGDSGGLECLGLHAHDARIPAEGVSFPGDLPAGDQRGRDRAAADRHRAGAGHRGLDRAAAVPGLDRRPVHTVPRAAVAAGARG